MIFDIPNIDVNEVESCVFKLYYGDRYLIIKGKTLSGSIYFLQKGYASFLAGGGGRGAKLGGKGHNELDTVNTYYRKFYRYLKRWPGKLFRIDIILESNNGYNLLKTEYLELQKSTSDRKCLNNNVTSYIPKYRESTGMYGWISKDDVLRFTEYLKQPLPVNEGSKSRPPKPANYAS